MRHLTPWVPTLSLLTLLFLIWGCAHHQLGLSLQLAVIGGLGIHAGVLLWAHRLKLHRLLTRLPTQLH
jgi:hypothetical protein